VTLKPGSGVTQGHWFGYQWKARVHIPISDQQQLLSYLAPFRRYGGLKVENRQFYLPHPHLTPPLWGNPSEFRDETCCRKTRGMGLPYGETFTILFSTVFVWSTRVTDGQTDGRPIAYMLSRVKMKHGNSILETFEYFYQIPSKSILIISSYTVSKLGHFLRYRV